MRSPRGISQKEALVFIKICWSCNDSGGMYTGEKGLWLQNLINLQADSLSQLNLSYRLQILIPLIFLESFLIHLLNPEGFLYLPSVDVWCFFPPTLILFRPKKRGKIRWRAYLKLLKLWLCGYLKGSDFRLSEKIFHWHPCRPCV